MAGYKFTVHDHATDEERFWPKVQKTDTCWLWIALIAPNGYGGFQTSAGKRVSAHRFSYELAHGKIQKGMQICHHCDVKRCVKPAHLFLGTHKDNMADMRSKDRQAKGTRMAAAKLTENDVRVIRNSAERNATIARTLGVSKVLIGLIRKRKAWQHVD